MSIVFVQAALKVLDTIGFKFHELELWLEFQKLLQAQSQQSLNILNKKN